MSPDLRRILPNAGRRAVIMLKVNDELFTPALPDDVTDKEAGVVAALLTRGRDADKIFFAVSPRPVIWRGGWRREDEAVEVAADVSVGTFNPRGAVGRLRLRLRGEGAAWAAWAVVVWGDGSVGFSTGLELAERRKGFRVRFEPGKISTL